jgi:hypothetical protein
LNQQVISTLANTTYTSTLSLFLTALAQIINP